MWSRWARFECSVAIWVLACITSCSISRQYPIKHHYGLYVERPAVASTDGAAARAIALRVAHFSASSSSEGVELIYRRSDQEYEADFYHEYFKPPAQLIEQAARKWLSESSLYATVLPAGSQIVTPWLLEGHLGAMYGDFRDAKAPRGVLEMEFLLLREHEGDPAIVLHRTYHEEQAISAATPAALVDGLRQALARSLARLETDLRAAKE